jgi:hypothetical protein
LVVKVKEKKMANKKNWLGILAIALVFGMTVVGCDDGGVETVPENLPVIDRWGKYVDPAANATLDYAVADDGVVTVTVGGIPEINSWDAWRANVGFQYTVKANKHYAYKIEAWTESGERSLSVNYYGDAEIYLGISPRLDITSARKTYMFIAKAPMPKNKNTPLEFQCADQLGTFYIKVISITEMELEQQPQKLTITGISSDYGWAADVIVMDTGGYLQDWEYGGVVYRLYNSIAYNGYGKPINGGKVTFDLWNLNKPWNEAGNYLLGVGIWGGSAETFHLYTGGKTYDPDGDMSQYTFPFTRNGSYTININQFTTAHKLMFTIPYGNIYEWHDDDP